MTENGVCFLGANKHFSCDEVDNVIYRFIR